MTSFSGIASDLFGDYVENNMKSFKNVKKALSESDLKVLAKTYVSSAILSSLISFLIIAIFSPLLISIVFGQFNYMFILMGLGFGVVMGGLVFAVFYGIPFYKASQRKRNINANLPFAINHMAAIASSGVPPIVIFRLLTGFKEYGEVSKESQKVVRNVDVFGQDLITSIRSVASNTPSHSFQELLESIVSTISTGGDLKKSLKDKAEKALFDYRIKRQKYVEQLSLYADFYTALLIAAPLFLVAILAIMSMIGGTVAGLGIPQVITLGVYVLIPLANIGFLGFIQLTQPEV